MHRGKLHNQGTRECPLLKAPHLLPRLQELRQAIRDEEPESVLLLGRMRDGSVDEKPTLNLMSDV